MTRELLDASMKQIYSFLTAAKCGNFTTAAEILFTSQTSVSRSISLLEQQLGFLLFYRHSNGVELTSAGEALYADWIEQVENMERSAELLRRQTSNDRTKLVLADFNNIPAEIYLLPLLNEFNRANPTIDLQVHRISMPDIIDGIRTKSVDAAFTSDPGKEIFQDAGYDLIKVTEINASIIVSEDNPALVDGKLDVSKLHNQPLIIMKRSRIEDFDIKLFERIREIAGNNNIEIGDVEYVESPHSLHFKLLSDNCWTILSVLDHKGLFFTPLPDTFEYFLGINQKHSSPEIKRFIRFVDQLFR
ncbi:MAG: LysR family transcriptional regulator [Oscillospiraceae bacterium]|nr:LysR family transcriptional regulator [Oscillospiraceae bacterium]